MVAETTLFFWTFLRKDDWFCDWRETIMSVLSLSRLLDSLSRLKWSYVLLKWAVAVISP